jgi:poly(3-hydroxybutyrate) depolymerase
MAQTPAIAQDDARQQFIRSLTLRPDRIITDSSYPSILRLAQVSSPPYSPTVPMKLKLSLAPESPAAKPIKELGTFEFFLHDLVQRPFAVSAEMYGVADGTYRIVAELTEGDAALTSLEQTIHLVEGIDARRGDVERRLTKITGHDSTKATIRYPFDLARVVNLGKRNYNAADLGIDQQGRPNYFDFTAGLKRSEQLLAALESGKDLLWQAKGDQKRHYWMEEAGEIMPYHVYVPPSWDGKTPLPMVFILHGNTRNQDFYFERDAQIIPKAAQQRGFMLVGVFGFYPNGGYNSGKLNRGGLSGGGRRGGVGELPPLNGMPPARIGELSEIDTMHVLELVKQEYPIDPHRTFLFGYSAGGSGAYYLGPKYAQNWAAIVLGGAGNAPTDDYPFDRLKGRDIPVFIFCGDQDSAGVRNNSTTFMNAMKQHGIDAQLKVYPRVNHDGGPAAGVADAFDFFAAHHRK